VLLYSRRGNDITKRFPAVAEAIATLPGGDLILDGELVAFNDVNRPDFHQLHRRRPTTVAWLFDLMHLGDEDLRDLPWTQRRRRLERLMARNKSDALHLNEIWDDGEALLRAASEQGLEGIVSKWRSSPYVSGDTDAWVKIRWRAGRKANAGGSSASDRMRMRREGVRQNAYRYVAAAARNRENQLRPPSSLCPVVTAVGQWSAVCEGDLLRRYGHACIPMLNEHSKTFERDRAKAEGAGATSSLPGLVATFSD
jgi:hypothetical protein